jgi:hypothetical protein
LNLDVSSGEDPGTNQAIRVAKLYARTHNWSPGPVENILVSPMREEGLARHTPALQAADFVVGEARRYVEDSRDFYNARPDGESTQDFRNAMTRWAEETGRKSPFHRGSYRALMSGKPYVVPHAWSFNSLCAFDDQRNGVWVLRDWKRR